MNKNKTRAGGTEPHTRTTQESLAFLASLTGRPVSLGSTLRSIRLGDENTLAEFAARIGVSAAYLSDVEHGRRRPNLRRAAEWGELLEYTAELFVVLALQDELRAANLAMRVTAVEAEPKRRRPRQQVPARSSART